MTVAMTDKGWTMTKEQEERWKVNGPLLVQEHVTEFREAYLRRGETGERAAYIKAIRALLGVLGLIPEHHGLSDGEPACMWFFDLTRHLEDLDTGVVPPAFRVRDVQRSALSTVLRRPDGRYRNEQRRRPSVAHCAAVRGERSPPFPQGLVTYLSAPKGRT